MIPAPSLTNRSARLLRLAVYAFFISFTGSLPVGTLNVSVTNLVIDGNLPAAFLFGIGAILVEVTMVRVALVIIGRLEAMHRLLGSFRLLACIVILLLAFINLEAAWHMRKTAAVIPFTGHAPFVSGVVLSLLNPLHLPFWMGWTALLRTKGLLYNTPRDYNVYVTAIGIGTGAAFLLYGMTGHLLILFLRMNQHLLNWLIGTALLLTGLAQIWRFFLNLPIITGQTTVKRIAAAIMLNPASLFFAKLPVYVKRLILFFTLLLLFSAEILRVWFLMPFPGSQVRNTVSYAYWLDQSIIWIRILALLLVCFALFAVFKKGRIWAKILLPLILVSYAAVFFAFNFRWEADKIFYQPVNKSFMAASRSDLDKSKLVIGVMIDGQAKAYPIQLIGYHHQVMDTVGNTPVMITYCTVCRSARVFSPIVNGKKESFRLVGMDHFNAVFEDATTKSWWQQATGTAITGPLKGYVLTEFPSTQLTLDAWLRQYPTSLVMNPDTLFMDNYFRLEDYDRGAMQSDLVRRDSASWQHNSWIVGVMNNFSSKAYDWNELLQKRVIQDSVDRLPILLTIENDLASFHAYDRRIDDTMLNFQISANQDFLVDEKTHSSWNMDGVCIDGVLKGKKLLPVQSYNEFWHTWQTFHRNAKIYVGNYTVVK